jgi:hypothetical protein
MSKDGFLFSRRDFLRVVFMSAGALALDGLSIRPARADLVGANPTAQENTKAGTTAWQLTNPATTGQIEGYASLTSVNRGGTILFFVDTASAYNIDIYRMGWYGGSGGRLTLSVSNLPATNQPAPLTDSQTGLIECPWNVSYTLNIPSPAADTGNNWCSGVYLAKLTATPSGKQAYIMFVVRDDARSSKLLFQSSVTTFQAYNTWGGKSLYDFQSSGGHANKVSYNRPYNFNPNLTNGIGASEFLIGGNDGSNKVCGWEYCMIRFLEREGYDVTYCTDIDTHENASLLLTHKAYLSVGHDEYWSWEMRNNVTAARNQGVGLCFFTANACYWQIRLEPSPLTGAPDRTQVCYKYYPNDYVGTTSHDPYATDGNSSNDYLITVRWRDGYAGTTRVALPEEALIGTMYDFGADLANNDMVVANASHWVFANTGLSNGDTLPGLVGYECDKMQGNSPANTVDLAHSPYTGNDQNQTGTGFSDMTLYTATSGATVFATGSIQWAWGLDDWGAPTLRNSVLNPAAQQIARNVLGRVAGLPVANPGGPYQVSTGAPIQFDGTGSYDPDGTIVSYAWNFGDGATGTGSTPVHAYANVGRYTVTLTVTDNDGNQSSATTAANNGIPYSIWNDAVTPTNVDVDTGNVEIGVKFQSDIDGYITGLQYYKNALNVGTHIGSLWNSAGQLLAQATFTNETATGWQQVSFTTPVAITKNTVYVASYHANTGRYNTDESYFANAGHDNPPLHALKDGASGGNGLYVYSTGPSFPNLTYNSENYWVDVMFFPTLGPDTTPPTVTAVSPAAGATNVAINTPVTATFSEALDTTTINASTFLLKDPANNVVPATVTYNTTARTATLTPSSFLTAATTYTARVVGGSAGVKDLAGNALASDYIWSFTTAAPDTTPPTVTAVSPAAGATNVAINTPVTASFSEALDTTTINASTFLLTGPGNTAVSATVSFNTANNTATLTPSAALAGNTTYTATVKGGSGGVKDLAGNALTSDYIWSFTTGAALLSIWGTSVTPANVDADTGNVELGVKFRSDVAGYIKGIRFYKNSLNTGTHTGTLWSSTGTKLASATFTNETASGWQQVLFTTSVKITANTIYVASYHAPKGHYNSDGGYFANAG